MSRYYHKHGAIWRVSKTMSGGEMTTWMDPELAVRLLALHDMDPCTADLAKQLRAALIEQQNEATEAAA